MFHLETVSVASGFQARVSQPAFDLVAIADAEVAGVETHGDWQRETIFPNTPAWNWLHADVQVMRRDRQVTAQAKGEARADAFVDRMAPISTNAKRTENIEVEVFSNRRSYLEVGPDLIVSAIYLRRSISHGQTQKTQN